MVMRFGRDPNESWLHHKEREWGSGSYPGPLWARFLLWCIHQGRRGQYMYHAVRLGDVPVGKFKDGDLVYAARARCKACGAGLAYPKTGHIHGEWDCSAVLKGEAAQTNAHETFPFAFYEIKSDGQPSQGGATTRPGMKRVIYGALWNTYVKEGE